MGIRIDPALELVWRNPTTAQLGTDPAHAVVSVLTAAEERFLLTLIRETPRAAVHTVAAHCGVSRERADALMAQVEPALRDAGPAEQHRVGVIGTGPLTAMVARLLASAGVTLVPLDDQPGSASLVVAIADHVTDPQLRARLLTTTTPHLPVVVGDGTVRVGPVTPDTDPDVPCAACLDLYRTDADPAWPVIAAQLIGRRPAALNDLACAHVAALIATTVLDHLRSTVADRIGVQVLVHRADLSVTRRRLRRHPTCGCQAPRGTGSQPVPHRAKIRAVTR